MATKVICFLTCFVSSCLAAPQLLVASPQGAVGSHTSQTLRSALGSHHAHHKTVTDLDGTAQVHRFDSRFHNNAGAAVVRVARPRLVTSGPFAVQALPHHAPLVVGGAAGSTPVITAARGSATNIFQTPDGRIFAFSNGAHQIAPGQIFQTPDGRIFTTAVINNNNNENNQDTEPQSEIIEAVRDSAEPEEEVEEMVEEEPEEDVTEAGEDSTEVPVLADEEVDQRTPTNQQDVVVTQTGTGLTSFVAVPQHHFVARAPLTPATSRFVPAALPNVVTHAGHVAVPQAGHLVHAAAAPAVVRAAVATPVAAPVSLPAVSSGYFTFPGAGIAFQF